MKKSFIFFASALSISLPAAASYYGSSSSSSSSSSHEDFGRSSLSTRQHIATPRGMTTEEAVNIMLGAPVAEFVGNKYGSATTEEGMDSLSTRLQQISSLSPDDLAMITAAFDLLEKDNNRRKIEVDQELKWATHPEVFHFLEAALTATVSAEDVCEGRLWSQSQSSYIAFNEASLQEQHNLRNGTGWFVDGLSREEGLAPQSLLPFICFSDRSSLRFGITSFRVPSETTRKNVAAATEELVQRTFGRLSKMTTAHVFEDLNQWLRQLEDLRIRWKTRLALATLDNETAHKTLKSFLLSLQNADAQTGKQLVPLMAKTQETLESVQEKSQVVSALEVFTNLVGDAESLLRSKGRFS